MERSLRKLNYLQKEALRYRSIEQRMDETGETQFALSDPDAKSMATTARMPRIVGFNVQTAVEADNHLIVAHEVTMLDFNRMTLPAARQHMQSMCERGQRIKAITRVKKLWRAKRLAPQLLSQSR